MYSYAQSKIAQLRQEQQSAMIQAIAVFVFCLFLSVLFPPILFKYVYASQQLTKEPALFGYIQDGSFFFGVLYFLLAAGMNFMRAGKIRKMEKDMEKMDMMMMGCGCGDCGCGECGDGCCGGACDCDGDACCVGCDGDCACDDHGSCECGCEDMAKTDKSAAAEMMKKTADAKKKSAPAKKK